MISRRVTAVVSCCALAAGYGFATAAIPTNLDAASVPERLVQAALEAEIQGNPAERERLLEEALQLDPNFEPARWHAGFVRIADQWVKLEDVPQHTAGDWARQAYEKKRQGLIDTADNHRELARFCRKNRLLEEERVHWAHVLEFNPQDAEALAGLGLEWHAGRLLTRAQIQAEKQAKGERLQAMRKWRPRLLAFRRDIESGTPDKIAQAERGLKQISDPDVIGVLEATFALNGDGDKIVALNRALVETVGRFQDPRATQVLLRRAMAGEPAAVRDLAIEQLKKRPMHAYVPQLIAALPGKATTRFHVFVLPGGTVLHEHEVTLEGRHAVVSLKLDATMTPGDAAAAATVTPRTLGREMVRAAAIENQVAATKQQLDFVRDRAQTVLARTTGFENVDDPELWQRQYDEYRGAETTTTAKPRFEFVNRQYEGYATPPVDQTVTITRAMPSCECFPKGTPVWTTGGPRPIEELQIGDRVLSQDTVTGELTYKPVQSTTLRRSLPLCALELDGETLEVTPGHPFWVAGEGWKMARQLEPGARVHAVRGPVEVLANQPGRTLEAYNLVVSEFHTYFVGDTMLLVHDNAPLGEQGERLPGLAAAP